VDACRDAWNWLMRMPEAIASIAKRTGAQVKLYGGRYQFATRLARPAGDETRGRLVESVGGEVGFVMVRASPRISWTRDA
jgi:hypothetical protein